MPKKKIREKCVRIVKKKRYIVITGFTSMYTRICPHSHKSCMHFTALSTRRCEGDKKTERIQFNQIVFAKQNRTEIRIVGLYRFFRCKRTNRKYTQKPI